MQNRDPRQTPPQQNVRNMESPNQLGWQHKMCKYQKSSSRRQSEQLTLSLQGIFFIRLLKRKNAALQFKVEPPIQQRNQQELLSNDQELFDYQQSLKEQIKYQGISLILKAPLRKDFKDAWVNYLIAKAISKIQQDKDFLRKAEINDIFQSIKALRYESYKVKSYNQQCHQQESKWQIDFFEQILKGFEVSDYSYLYKLQDKLEQFIYKIIDSINWSSHKLIYEPLFKRFLDMMMIKIAVVKESRIIYRALFRIRFRIEVSISYKGLRKRLNGIEDHLTDLLFRHYMQYLRIKSTRSDGYYIRDPTNNQRVPLAEYIASCPQFFKDIGSWREIFAVIKRHFDQMNSDYDCQRDEAMRLFMANIHRIPYPVYDCLGCTQYFFVNHNIYRQQLCKHTFALLGPISQIEKIESLIKDEIAALLNKKGGVLLFDCSKTYYSVIPRGSYFIQHQKHKIQQQITGYLEGIFPQPKINKNIFITWVPMKQDPFELSRFPKGKDYKLNYIEGLYVCRITVKPTHGHIVYFWNQEQTPIFSLRAGSLFPEGKIQLKGRSITRFIKSKFKRFADQIKVFNQFERMVAGTQASSIGHQCIQPESGVQTFQKKKEIIVGAGNPQRLYKHASVAIVKKQNTEAIRKKLLKYGVTCIIQSPFEALKLKGAASSAIIYHNTRFEELLSILSNNEDFEFEGKPLLIIRITDYVKLTERNQKNIMSEAEFNNLEARINRNYPKQKLKMWKFITDDYNEEFYIQTQSKESSLYIYMVMANFFERVAFKSPRGLERMDKLEKQAKLRLYYPLKLQTRGSNTNNP